jgi:hypothetical protein
MAIDGQLEEFFVGRIAASCGALYIGTSLAATNILATPSRNAGIVAAAM